MASIPNDNQAIFISSLGSNVIGGPTAGARNIISGNLQNALSIESDGGNNIVQGNWIGLDATGLVPLANGETPLGVNNTSNNQIGGPNPGEGNVIASAGPGFAAMVIGGFGALTEGNIVQGNFINTDSNGDTGPGFSSATGIAVLGNADNNLIGGTGAGEGNLVKNSTSGGVGIFDLDFLGLHPTGNAILGNSISETDGPGIELILDSDGDFNPDTYVGANVNDIGDGDVGPNDLLNYPVFFNIVTVGGGNVDASYYLDVPAGDYRVEFFSNSVVGYQNHGEGETFLGFDTITHTGAGIEEFTSTFSASAGDIITATVTEDLGGGTYRSTSEFSSTTEVNGTGLDFGDAPDTGVGTAVGNYNTTALDNGAYHIIGEVFLGECTDADDGTLQNTTATADEASVTTPVFGNVCSGAGDDADGVAFTETIGWGNTVSIDVVASGAGQLNVWIDFNDDGDFNDLSEQIFDDEVLIGGVNSLTFPVPAGAGTTVTYSRFRFNSTDINGIGYNLEPIGESLDGEVEDYQVTVLDAGTATIGNLVWEDLDENGTLNGLETGINNVGIKLYMDDGDSTAELGTQDTLISSQLTAGGGLYTFTNLPAGSYWVQVVDINNTLVGYEQVSGVSLPEFISILAGQNYTTADYGFHLSDADNDGITDLAECPSAPPLDATCEDSDGDGIPNFQDSNSDNDGFSDLVEGVLDTDGDGIPNRLESNIIDSDGDGSFDFNDNNADNDGNGNDGTGGEQNGVVTGPWNDTDGDGIPNHLDGDDTNIAGTPDGSGDSDGDTLSDTDECLTGYICPDTDGDGIPNYADLDSDGDSISDEQETIDGTDPYDANSPAPPASSSSGGAGGRRGSSGGHDDDHSNDSNTGDDNSKPVLEAPPIRECLQYDSQRGLTFADAPNNLDTNILKDSFIVNKGADQYVLSGFGSQLDDIGQMNIGLEQSITRLAWAKMLMVSHCLPVFDLEDLPEKTANGTTMPNYQDFPRLVTNDANIRWIEELIYSASYYEILNGTHENTVEYYRPILTSEALKMLVRVGEFTSKKEFGRLDEAVDDSVSPEAWYYEFLSKAASEGTLPDSLNSESVVADEILRGKGASILLDVLLHRNMFQPDAKALIESQKEI